MLLILVYILFLIVFVLLLLLFRSRTSNQEYGPPILPTSNQNGFDRTKPATTTTNQTNAADPMLGKPYFIINFLYQTWDFISFKVV